MNPDVDLIDEARAQISSARSFLRRVLRAWPAALCVLVLGAAACAAWIVYRRPAYRSETVILYSEPVRAPEDNDQPETTRSVTARLKEILVSRSSLDGIVRQFDLYPAIRRSRGPVDAAEELKKHIEFRAPGGDTFSIAFTGSSAGEAQAVTARLAELVIEQDSGMRKKQALSVQDFLQTEKTSTEEALKEAELALASFMAAHPRFALDATPLATGAAIRASLGAAGTGASGTGASAPERSVAPIPRPSVAGVNGVSHPALPDAPTIRDAVAEEVRAKAAFDAAKANLIDLTARFTPMHPDVRAAQAEMGRASTRLAAATAALADAERSAAVAAPSPRAPVPASPPPPVVVSAPGGSDSHAIPREDRATISPLVAAASPADRDVVTLETQWVKLTRRATEARLHQDQVEAALFKATMAANSERGDGLTVTTIDPAFLPETALPPSRPEIMAIFAAGSLFLAILVAALKALTDDRVYDERDVREVAPLLALVPHRDRA